MTSQMNFLTRVRKSTIVTVFITSFWLSVVFTYYVPMLVVLPLALVPKVGVKFYRLLIGFYDVYWGRWACLSVPFSHCNTQMFINKDGYAMLDEHKGSGNSLLLSTHGSRIDWLFGVFIGMVPRNQARIGFVAEVTAALMVCEAKLHHKSDERGISNFFLCFCSFHIMYAIVTMTKPISCCYSPSIYSTANHWMVSLSTR